MARNNQVVLTLAGDSSDLERAFRNAGMSADKFDRDLDGIGGRVGAVAGRMGSALLNFGKVAAVGLAVGAAAAVHFGLNMVQAAEESAKVTRQTDAVIQSMGASAWTSAKQVAELAEQLSNKSGIDDELIQSGANVLLTFGNIRNEVGRGNRIFERATTIALDMSVALGQDLQSSVTQVGKALNDPIAGISALSRVGVQFSDDQKAMIASLVETGDLLGAQRIILDELDRQFEGSAEAQATASQRMQTAWENLQESIGEQLLPAFEKLTDWVINTGIPWFEDFAAMLEEKVVPVIKDIWAWVQDSLVPALEDLATKVRDELQPIWEDFVDWVESSLIPNLKAIWFVVEQEIGPALQEMWSTVRDELIPAIKNLVSSIADLLNIESDATSGTDEMRESWSWLGTVLEAAYKQFAFMVGIISDIIDLMATLVGWADRAAEALRSIKIPRMPGTSGQISALDIVSPLGSILGGGKKAKGGPVRYGAAYIVGEQGPEVFRPGATGAITPTAASMKMMAGGGGSTTVVNVYNAGSVISERQLEKSIRDMFARGAFRSVA